MGFKFGQNIYETPTQGINWFNEESNMGISGPKLKLFGPEICTDFSQLNIEVLKLDDYDHYDDTAGIITSSRVFHALKSY